jgi:GH15 family glucan-1,4-alpha-glucosidase
VARRIEDYALLGDTRSAALVGRNGSIDWFCAPRFDSGAMFAALLGGVEHGRWLLAPEGGQVSTRRRYRDGTLILETEFECAQGAVRLIDLMPITDGACQIVRVVEGIRGRVTMEMELVVRFDYGERVPWVTALDGGILAVAGPDAVVLRSAVETRGEGLTTRARFLVGAGEHRPFVLSWYPSHQAPRVRSMSATPSLRPSDGGAHGRTAAATRAPGAMPWFDR